MQKAGTGWFFEQMGNHPDIWQPPIKELHVLNCSPTERTVTSLLRRHEQSAEDYNGLRAERGLRLIEEVDVDFVRKLSEMTGKTPDLERYAALFAAKGNRLSGDVTPAYSSLTQSVISQVAEGFPRIRIILLVREPVDRAWSYVSMIARRPELEGGADMRVDDWADVAARLSKRGPLMRSKPSSIVRRWRPFFGDRLGVFFFDDLRDDAAGLRRRMAAFIGADPDRFGPLEADLNRKASKAKVPMPDEIRERLVAQFADEIRTSAEELGGRALEWPARHGL